MLEAICGFSADSLQHGSAGRGPPFALPSYLKDGLVGKLVSAWIYLLFEGGFTGVSSFPKRFLEFGKAHLIEALSGPRLQMAAPGRKLLLGGRSLPGVLDVSSFHGFHGMQPGKPG